MSTAPVIHSAALGTTGLATFGFEWSFPGPGRLLRTEAKIEASLSGADIIALRDDVAHPQFGLGRRSPALRRTGVVAAMAFAGALAAQTVQAGCGLFRLRDGKFWLVQVKADQIPPDGDRLFDTEEAALEAFAETIRQERRWPRIYAPADLIEQARAQRQAPNSAQPDFLSLVLSRSQDTGPNGISPIELPQLLSEHTGSLYRRCLSTRRTSSWGYVGSAAAASTLLFGSAAYLLYPVLFPPPPPPPPPKPVAIAVPPPPPAIDTPPPLEGKPLAVDFVDACLTAFATLDDSAPLGAWAPTRLNCDGTDASLDLDWDGGATTDLAAAYPGLAIVYPRPDYGLATVVQPLPKLEGRHYDPAAMPAVEPLRRSLVDLGRQVGTKVVVGVFAAPPRAKEDIARWTQADIDIPATDPRDWAPLLAQYPTLVITSISIDLRQLRAKPAKPAWHIGVTAYGT